MADENADEGAPPTPRELRAARRRAHEVEKERRGKQGGGGKGDKKGSGGQQPDAGEQRHRR